ncbi:hypothetical protein CVT24_001149 [Panaeolus cyanescens]|uniref:Uncharacterized protein n=1 Tax=Panaeolus cyanescens TaxID=181874 RepID=A0A409WXP5_9AGAR|nr:hypothetical protein CVT24_001149 [Panaeolus cyanescens]
MIAVDQHDKWKRFGLALHTGVDPFSGVIHWIKVWWTNSNPKLILSYYLDLVTRQKAMPLVTQSDPGSENYGIANGHTALRHLHDPSLEGTVQHRWMRHKKNIKPEIAWSQLRRRFTPGFENIIEQGVLNGWYDISRPLDLFVFRWIFIPFLQGELDAWADMVNSTQKRADRNKILPHGAPNDIQSNPERFGCLNFKIDVDMNIVEQVRKEFAPPTDPVFELVPPKFAKYADILFESMGRPVLTTENVWDVYRELLHRFEHLDDAADFVDCWEVYYMMLTDDDQHLGNGLQAPEGQELAGGMDDPSGDGHYYMGGVNNGQGLDVNIRARLDDLDVNDDDFEVVEACFSDQAGDDVESEDEWAVLCDYGLLLIKADVMSRSSSAFVNTALARSASYHWMAPELFQGGKPKESSDIYAFAMTMYEIYTDDTPLGHLPPSQLRDITLKYNTRPDRPELEEAPAMTTHIWELISECIPPCPSTDVEVEEDEEPRLVVRLPPPNLPLLPVAAAGGVSYPRGIDDDMMHIVPVYI